MSIFYPCNICDKQFNLNIKLKKHLKKSHASKEDENQLNDAPKTTVENNEEVSEKSNDVKNSKEVEEEKNESSFSFDQRHTPIDHDDTIPNDWKSAYIDVFNNRRSKVFLSPDGTYLLCRRLALIHMTKNNSPEEDVMIMRRGLLDEGWTEIDDVSQGWMTKVLKYSDKETDTFISNEHNYLRNRKQALIHMLQHRYPDEEIVNFIRKFMNKRS